MTKRALGNVDPIDEDGVWKNVASNLSRQPEKELATDLLRYSREVHTGTVKSLASAFQPTQQRAADGKEPTTLHRGFAERRDETTVAKAATDLSDAVQNRATETERVVRLLQGPDKAEVAKAVREARRSVRNAAARPKRRRDVPTIPPTEAQAEFADALHRAGLRPKGAPVMDGRKHRVPVEGDKRGRMSGTDIGHLNGYPAGYIHNFKSGDEIR